MLSTSQFEYVRLREMPEEVDEPATADIDPDDLEERTNKLTNEQSNILDDILSAVDGETTDKLFFLDAPGGTGYCTHH